MKNALLTLFSFGIFWAGCSNSQPNFRPELAPNYLISLQVNPNDGSTPGQALEEVKSLLLERMTTMDITYSGLNVDASKGQIKFDIVDLPKDWGTGETGALNLREKFAAQASLAFADTYRISDPGIVDAFKNYGLDTLEAAGLEINDGNWSPSVLAFSESDDLAKIEELIYSTSFLQNLPRNLRMMWSYKKDDKNAMHTPVYFLYGVKMEPTGKYPLTEEFLKGCVAGVDQATGEPILNLEFDEKGAEIWGRMTTQAAQNGNRDIAIILNEKVVSAPRVMSPISGGRSMITGDFSLAEVHALADQLRLAMLPHEIVVLDANTY